MPLASTPLDQFAQQFATYSAGLPVAGDAVTATSGRGLAAAPPLQGADAAVPLQAKMQLMVPAPAWDWPVDANGSSSQQLYEFCSWMPENQLPTAAYAASAYRFSDSYQAFLQALPASPMVTTAQTSFSASANQVEVLYATGPKLMPAWMVSQFPSQFVASASGQPASAATIRVQLANAAEAANQQAGLFTLGQSTAGSGTDIPFSAGEVGYVDIHADAWGQIAIRPGGWYSTALPALRRNGPFRDGATSGDFFGPNGIMRCLLSGIFVGLNVSVVASLSPRLTAELVGHSNPDLLVRVAGFEFAARNAAVAPGDQAGRQTVSFAASAPATLSGTSAGPAMPLIVGVSVADL